MVFVDSAVFPMNGFDFEDRLNRNLVIPATPDLGGPFGEYDYDWMPPSAFN